MSQPSVFISYSHKDEEEKEQLVSHLSVLLMHSDANIDLWVDDQIEAGGDWEADIHHALDKADVAMLLVSVSFLTSKFIRDTEVPRLLERREKEGVVVYPVIAKPCPWQRVPWLARMNVKPKNGLPVWRDGGRYVDEELAKIADDVARILDRRHNNR